MTSVFMPLLFIFASVVIVFLIRLLVVRSKPRRVETVKEFLDQGKVNKAIQRAKQILAKNSRNGDAHYLLAKAYIMDSKKELAFMEYKAVEQISIFSDICPEAQFRKEVASLYLEFGEQEEALKEFILLIKLEPDDGYSHYQAGKLFEQRNNSKKAVSYYKKAIELTPEFPEALNAYGKSMYRARFLVEAKDSFLKAIQYKPDFPQAYLYLGRVYKDTKNYTNALVAFERALNDPEVKVSALIERGICFLSMKNYGQAQNELERAIRLADNEVEANEILLARYNLSICYEKFRQLDKAIAQWKIIDRTHKNYKDIPKKLNTYKPYGLNDLIKEFFTMNLERFEQTCCQITKILGFSIVSYSSIKNGSLVIAEKTIKKKVNQFNSRILIQFLRVPENISLSSIREFNEKLRKMSMKSGCFITCSEFSYQASEFASVRRIELIGGGKLGSLLQKIENGSVEG